MFSMVLHAAHFAAACCAADVAQTVRGTVRDSSGAGLPNVQVVVAEANRSATTNAGGEFTIRGLAAGEYHLTTLLVGYRPGHAVVQVANSGPDVVVNIVMSATPLRLDAVSVTGSPTGTDPERVAQATVEVSGLALQRTLATDLAKTLAQEPGVSVRFNGPATMPVIRGLTGDRILVLQDGARTADLSSSASDHANTLDPLSASRIEVVRGPASLLYGNNALGGVVNVISNDIPTSVPSLRTGMAALMAESGAPGASASLGGTTRVSENWAASLRGTLQSRGSMGIGGAGSLENTQSRNWSATGGLGWIGSRATAGASLATYDFDYGLPVHEDEHAAGEHESVSIVGRRTAGSARATLNTGWVRLPFLKLDASAQQYAHDEVHGDGEIGTSFDLKTQTLNASAKTTTGRVHGSIGAQFLARDYEARGEEALTPAATSRGFGAFFYQELALSGDPQHDLVPTLSFGGRFDTWRIRSSGGGKFGLARTVNVSSPSGSLGLSIPLGSMGSLSGSAAMAFRAPTVEELFSNAEHHATASYERGNPALDTEQSRGLEAVLRLAGARTSFSFSAYTNRINDYIYPNVVRDTIVGGETLPLAVYEQTDATLSGVEGSFEFHAGRALVLGAMGDYVRGSLTDNGGPLPFMPPARLGGSVRWDDGRWNIGGDVRRSFAQDRVTGGADVETAAFTLLNASAGVNVIVGGRVHTLTLRVDNLGDVRYFDATSRIKEFAASPGRNFALVYKLLLQ